MFNRIYRRAMRWAAVQFHAHADKAERKGNHELARELRGMADDVMAREWPGRKPPAEPYYTDAQNARCTADCDHDNGWHTPRRK